MQESNSSVIQQQGSCSTLVIDGDAIPYMLGWHHRDHTEIEIMHSAVDQWMNDFLTITQATKFIGIIAHDKARCFRYDYYKYKPYKGNRSEKDPWIVYWEPIVRERLQSKWGFVQSPVWLETDDIIALIADCNPEAVICSPDKDLRQIPGYHYNYRSIGEEKHKGLEVVTVKEAIRNFYTQILTGDSTDNIAGCTGMGDVKAKKLLDETGEMLWGNAVKLAFQKQYGPYYGDIIYAETVAAIQLFTTSHPLWDKLTTSYGLDVEFYRKSIRNSGMYGRSIPGAIEREIFS